MSYFKASNSTSFDADLELARKLQELELENHSRKMSDASLAWQIYEQENENQANYLEAQRIQREWNVQPVYRVQPVERKDTFYTDRAIAEELQRNDRYYSDIGLTVHESNRIVVQDGSLIFKCPHCGGRCAVFQSEIACTIVTHAVTAAGQVNQHLSPAAAAALKASGTVIAGCCLQYTLVANADGSYKAEKCSGR